MVGAIDHDQGRHDLARQLSGQDQPGESDMTSDMIEIWAGILGLAYLAAAGLYFEVLSARKHSHGPASHGFGRHIRPYPVKIRDPR